MQKNFYLFIVCMSASLVSGAQFKKGSVLLGGDIQYGTQSTSSTTASNASSLNYLYLTPSIGKAIKDNLVAGIDLNYYSTSQNQPSISSSEKSHSYGANLFLRKYKSLGGRFYIFTQGSLGGAYFTSSNQSVNPTQNLQSIKGYYMSMAFYPGISYAITDHVQVETGFQNLLYAQYSHQNETDNDPGATPDLATSKTNGFSVGTSLNHELFGFVAGVRVLIGH